MEILAITSLAHCILVWSSLGRLSRAIKVSFCWAYHPDFYMPILKKHTGHTQTSSELGATHYQATYESHWITPAAAPQAQAPQDCLTIHGFRTGEEGFTFWDSHGRLCILTWWHATEWKLYAFEQPPVIWKEMLRYLWRLGLWLPLAYSCGPKFYI